MRTHACRRPQRRTAGRRAPEIGEHGAALGQPRLFFVVFGHFTANLVEKLRSDGRATADAAPFSCRKPSQGSPLVRSSSVSPEWGRRCMIMMSARSRAVSMTWRRQADFVADDRLIKYVDAQLRRPCEISCASVFTMSPSRISVPTAISFWAFTVKFLASASARARIKKRKLCRAFEFPPVALVRRGRENYPIWFPPGTKSVSKGDSVPFRLLTVGVQSPRPGRLVHERHHIQRLCLRLERIFCIFGLVFGCLGVKTVQQSSYGRIEGASNVLSILSRDADDSSLGPACR